MKTLTAALLVMLLLPAACARDGKPASWGPSRWDVNVEPPEKLNRNDSHTPTKDDYCTDELKARKGC